MQPQKPKIVGKVWGIEEIGETGENYTGKVMHLDRGFRCSIHRHKKDETFRIISGVMFIELGENPDNMENMILREGAWIRIPSNSWHRFSGIEDSVFCEFSESDCESERKTQSGRIENFEEWKKEVLG